jgi:hypothetical protein
MLKNILLLVASLFCGLVIIEIALRFLGWTFPIFAQPDPELGWSFRPRINGWSSHENTAYIRINRFGFRGNDWLKEPATGTFRVAVIGDSSVDSSNLPEENAITSEIERHLRTCPILAGGPSEVLNLGVSGYGTAQEYLLLRHAVDSFHPNLILLVFYAGNDVADNSRLLSLESQRARPYFVEDPSGNLRLDVGFRDSDAFRKAISSDWEKRIVNASYLLQALKQFHLGKSIWPLSKSLQVAHDKGPDEQGLFAPEFPEVFSPPSSEIWKSAWSVTEKLLVKMRDWTLGKNVDFALVIIPAPIQALPTEERRRAAARKFKLADLDYPVERTARLASQSGIPFLNLLNPLRDYGDSERAFLYGFPPLLGNGHLNAEGNGLSGRTIANWLCQRAAGTSTRR